ncbi:putative membrane protein [Orientia tsutsugamushi str. UT76]|nr:putative membrane protein [Orientia tsutsugamushi str. UT76]
MPALNIDLILVGLFLVANLAIGLWYGKEVKSVRDYALGGRNFSTSALTATLIATWIGVELLVLGYMKYIQLEYLQYFLLLGKY